MRGLLTFVGGLGAGASLMLLLDPAEGGRRRASLRDRLGRAMRATETADAALCDRIRGRLGHVVSYPRAIDVSAEDGRVMVTGAIPRSERPGAIAAIARVAGVRSVDDCLDETEDLETLTAIARTFDGGGLRHSVPAGRVLVGVAVASGLAFYGARRVAREPAAAWAISGRPESLEALGP
jgi:hypothetical protein